MKDSKCLIAEFEPQIVKAPLENEDYINAMNKDITKFEKTNTWTLVLTPRDKNVLQQS